MLNSCRQIVIFAGIFRSDGMKEKKNDQVILYTGMLLFLGIEIIQIAGVTGTILELLLRVACYIGAALTVYAAGRLGCQWFGEGCLKERSLTTAAAFYGLYVLSGTCQRLVRGGDLLDNLIRTALFVKVPETAENWLFAAVVFALTAAVLPFLLRMHHKKIWLPLLTVGGLCVTLIPGSFFGYPVFGVFLGTDSYRCLPVLAFAGYFLWGMFSKYLNKRIRTVLTAVALVFSLGVCLWKKTALLGDATYPSRYWEILLPVGFAAVIVLILHKETIQKLVLSILPHPFAMAFAEVTVWYMFRIIFGAQNRVWQVALLTMIIYLAIFPADILCRYLQRWIRDGGFDKWSRGKLAYVLAYTVGFAILAVLVFMPFWEEGRTFIWNMDGISQYFPRAVSFSQSVRDGISSLLQGDFHFSTYDFTWGLGDHVVLSFNPFYWCYALFAPENMETGYQVMTIVRFYLTGLSASALFLYLKKGRFASLLGSYVYVFCGYALHLCLYHPQFSYALMFFPLLIIAVEEILTRKRWYLGTVMVGISLLWSYYFLYINTIALVVYFLVRFFCMEKTQRTLRQFVQYILMFAGTYILGVGIGFLGLMSSFSSYAGSSRTASGGLDTVSGGDYGANWILGLMQSLINTGKNPGYSLRLGFIGLVWIALVILFIRWRERKGKCILVALCFVASCLPVIGYAWNGFSYVSNRWSYIIALLMGALVADAVMDIRSLTKKELRILFLATIPYMAVCLYYSEFSDFNAARALAVLMISLLVVVLSAKSVNVFHYRGMQAALSVLVAASLLVNSNVYFTEDGLNNSRQFAKAGTAFQKATDTGIQVSDAVEDDGFYRVGTTVTDASKMSGALVEEANGITYYNSTYNKRISDYLSSLGVTGYNKVMFDGFDNRGFLNALASVKYYVTQTGDAENAVPYGFDCIKSVQDKYEEEDGEADYLLYQAEMSLPIGYTYDKTMSQEEFETYSSMEKQEIMMTHAVVDEAGVSEEEVLLTGHKAEKVSVLMNGPVLEGDELSFETGDQIIFSFDGVENAETYVYFKGYAENDPLVDGYVRIGVSDGTSYYSTDVWSHGNRYDTGQEYYIFNTGYHEDALHTVTVTFSTPGKLYLEDWGIYVQSMENYDTYISDLGKDALENVTVDHNQVSGTVSLDKEKLLVLSIPYEKGWTALVDGEETELLCANLMYTGIQLEEGEHTIELSYVRPGLKKGAAVSGISILLFLSIIFVQRKRKIK